MKKIIPKSDGNVAGCLSARISADSQYCPRLDVRQITSYPMIRSSSITFGNMPHTLVIPPAAYIFRIRVYLFKNITFLSAFRSSIPAGFHNVRECLILFLILSVDHPHHASSQTFLGCSQENALRSNTVVYFRGAVCSQLCIVHARLCKRMVFPLWEGRRPG